MRARNRFLAATPEQAAERLVSTSNQCLDDCTNPYSWNRVHAACQAEAAAHWAFTLHPELRVDDTY